MFSCFIVTGEVNDDPTVRLTHPNHERNCQNDVENERIELVVEYKEHVYLSVG